VHGCDTISFLYTKGFSESDIQRQLAYVREPTLTRLTEEVEKKRSQEVA
jgi:hypothetical protein